MQKENPSRREREKLRQRQEILDCALGLFSEKGYHNVSMHEIAGKSEFAIGTLYKFFQNKEDLYKALLLELCNEFDSAFAQAVEEPNDEVEKLRNYIRTKGEKFRDNLPFIRLYLSESGETIFNTKPGLSAELRKGYYNFLDKLAAVFEQGIKSKRFKSISSPYLLAVALDSVVNNFLLLWLNDPEKHRYPQDPDTILNIFLKGLTE